MLLDAAASARYLPRTSHTMLRDFTMLDACFDMLADIFFDGFSFRFLPSLRFSICRRLFH